MIIIMFNNINREILNESPSQKYQLPQLKTGYRIPTNYIKEYFQLKTLITIPHIDIAAFYQKIHTIRSVFVTQIENPKEFLIKQYSLRLSIGITDNMIHSSRQIIQRVQSLNKSNFVYQEEIDTNKARRLYFGQMNNGKKEGYGIYAEYQSNLEKQSGPHFYFYEGFFSENYKNGLGMQWSQNRIFIGQFINNTHFSHAEAVFLYNNGDIYVGSIFNYKRNGRGVLFQSKPKNNQYYKYQTSQRYNQYETIVVGSWEDDQVTRKNKFMLTTKLNDIFSMSLYDFQSNLIVKTTTVYVGDVKLQQKSQGNIINSKESFVKEGRGFQYFSNGDIYKGEYVNDKPHGYGHYIWSNKDEYHGQFMNGQREGSGQWKGENRQFFQGQYHKDQRNGYGIYQWPNGNLYEGQFKNDNRNGIGKMTWADGQLYIGKWKKGVQHGQGQVRAHLFSCPIQKQFIFENGQAVKSQSQKKELSQLKGSAKRKLSNKTHKQKSQQASELRHFSMDNLKTKKKNMTLTQTKLDPSFYKSFKTPTNQDRSSSFSKDFQINKRKQGETQELDAKKGKNIKQSAKLSKKQKIKSIFRSKRPQQSPLGETLLKPIKWSNFYQSQQAQP